MPQSPEAIVHRYTQAKSNRVHHETDWRNAAAHCLPQQYARWNTDGPGNIQQGLRQVRRIAYDTTGQRSLPKYRAVLERMATPAGMKWHGLTASDERLRAQPRVRAYFEQLTNQLFRARMNPRARFRISTSEVYNQIGTYGNGPMFIARRDRNSRNPQAGIKYNSVSLRDVFWTLDNDGNVFEVFRRMHLNADQFKLQFPDVTPPESVASELSKPNPSLTRFFEVIFYVAPRDDEEYDPTAMDDRRHAYQASYVMMQDKQYVGEPFGYAENPWAIPRSDTVSGDGYGYSPAALALAAMGTASSIKKVTLKQGNRAVDPAWLTAESNAMNGTVDARPGAINPGGLDRQGNELIKRMQTGDFRVAEKLLQDERIDIEDSFFVTLFQILQQTPEMTATEVIERVSERTALLSPTMGRLQSEFLGPVIDRELSVLNELGQLMPPPPELVEAMGDFDVLYTSPMARSINAEEVGGFVRSVELALNTAQATQDFEPLDHFNFDTAIPEIADTLAVPARWMNAPDQVEARRAQRAEQLQQQQLLQNAAGLASAGATALDAQNAG